MSELVFIPAAGVAVRGGDVAHVGIPTWQRIVALAPDDGTAAAEMLEYLISRELRPILTVYHRWIPALIGWMHGRTTDRRAAELVSEAFEQGVRDGRAVDPQAIDELIVASAGSAPDEARWVRLVSAALGEPGEETTRSILEDAARQSLGAGDCATALVTLVDAYRDLHDVLVRVTWATMAVAQREFGEEAVADMLRESVTGPMVRGRTTYAQLANMTGEQIMLMTAETMRSHFSGASARGEVSILEEPDRYVLAFAPCGSGGRARRETQGQDGVLATRAAYVAGAHDWTWGEAGVCIYCAHCAFVNEILPIEGIGFPKRVTLYPQDPTDACRWIVYKDSTAVPDEYFSRVGLSRQHRNEGAENNG